MAYMFKDDEELQKKLAKNAPGGVSGGSAGSGVISGAGGGETASPIAPKPSAFVGIKQYLDANKNQAAGLGEKVGGFVEQGANDTKLASAKATNDASSGLDKNIVGFDAAELGKVASDPTKANASAISKMMNANSALEGASGSLSKEQQENIDKLKATAAERLKNLSSEEGRKSLINQTYVAPQRSQTAGIGNFDNMLLQSDPYAKDRLRAAEKAADLAGVEKAIAANNARLGAKYNNVKEANKNVADKTKAAVDKARTDFETGTAGALDARIEAIKNANLGAVNWLKAGKELSDKDLSILGLTREQAEELRGASDREERTKGLTIGDMSGLTRGAVATPEEIAKYRALMKLSGADAAGGIFDPDKAGGNPGTDFVDFNYVAPPTQVPMTPAETAAAVTTGNTPGMTTSGGSGSQAMLPPEVAGAKPLENGYVPTNTPGYNPTVGSFELPKPERRPATFKAPTIAERLAAGRGGRIPETDTKTSTPKPAPAAAPKTPPPPPPRENAGQGGRGGQIKETDIPAPKPAAPKVNTAANVPAAPTMQEKKFSKLMRDLELEF